MTVRVALVVSCLLASPACSGGDNNTEREDAGNLNDEFFSVTSARRQSLELEGRPLVVLAVEINNKLSSGLIVQTSAIRLVTFGSSEEITGESYSVDGCPTEPIILTPGGKLRCSLYFDLDLNEVPEKASLVTISEGTERPSVREEAAIGSSFSECELCGTTCMPGHINRCGTCSTSCASPPNLDAMCLGGYQEQFSQETPEGRSDHDRERIPVECVTWLSADNGDCATRCAADGLACIQGLGRNSNSSDPEGNDTLVFGSFEEYAEDNFSYVGNCQLSAEDNEFRVRMWCACHPGI